MTLHFHSHFYLFVLNSLVKLFPELPEVLCGPETLNVKFKTQQTFSGRIFVNGHSNEPQCVSRDVGSRTTEIAIPKFSCGVETLRTVLYYTVKSNL